MNLPVDPSTDPQANTYSLDALANKVLGDALGPHREHALYLGLRFGDRCIRVITNHAAIKSELVAYFKEYTIPDDSLSEVAHFDTEVYTLESQLGLADLGVSKQDLVDWSRDIGKSGRKDAFIDLENGRIMHKVRTGMNYLQNSAWHIAFGPACQNSSQVINFILTQHMTYLQHEGCVICHSSAISKNGKGIAFSAYSGGGKSTLALKMMNHGLDFVSNDRLFVRSDEHSASAIMHGVAKQPRINPGTILNNPSLSTLIGESRKTELLRLSKQDLWELEEKYDAPIDLLYGPNRFVADATLGALVILNWNHDSQEPTTLTAVSLPDQPHLLDAVMKSPGPFHYSTSGQPWPNGETLDPSPYLDAFKGVSVFEIAGKVDFEAAASLCMELINGLQ